MSNSTTKEIDGIAKEVNGIAKVIEITTKEMEMFFTYFGFYFQLNESINKEKRRNKRLLGDIYGLIYWFYQKINTNDIIKTERTKNPAPTIE